MATAADGWMFTRLAKTVAAVDAAFDSYEFGEVTRLLYGFIWNEFCDWYIEFSKSRLSEQADPEDRLCCQRNLVFMLDQIIRLLHPIMPFITEEIYRTLPKAEDAAPMLIIAHWPDAQALAVYDDEEAERAIAMVCIVVGAIRSTRARYGISPKTALDVAVKAQGTDEALLEKQRDLIETLGTVAKLTIAADVTKAAEDALVVGDGIEIYVNLAGHVDFEAERKRLEKEQAKLSTDVQKLDKKLSNPGFLAKAAPEIVEKDRNRLAELSDKLERIEQALADLS